LASRAVADWPFLQTLFVAYRAGNSGAARQVFGPLLACLTAFFRMRTGSNEDAADLAQACLLKLHFARDRYDPERSFKTWVFTVASRCLIDHWRSGKNHLKMDSLDGEGDAPELASPELPHDLRLEFNEELTLALGTLKPIDRTIVYLYGVEGLAMAEVAKTVGLSEAAVKVRAHRSYVKLRRLLTSVGGLLLTWWGWR